jgi:hypothetical protein
MTTKKTLVTAGIGLFVAAVTATSITLATGGEAHSAATALTSLSNPGRSVELARTDPKIVRSMGAQRASLLAVRGRLAYYRMQTKDGTCFSVGDASALGRIGGSECPRGPFPTRERPVLDLSIYETASHERGVLSLYRAEGIAADGVSSVAFTRADGSVVLRLPVRGNVYSATAVPSAGVTHVVAYNASGAEVWRSP